MIAAIQFTYYSKYDMNMLAYLQKNRDRYADKLYVHFNINEQYLLNRSKEERQFFDVSYFSTTETDDMILIPFVVLQNNKMAVRGNEYPLASMKWRSFSLASKNGMVRMCKIYDDNGKGCTF